MKNRTTRISTPRRGLGFTLIELIVAIGAIAIIAVGIAAIFESVGRTVAGGRRVSNLNQFASLIERQMRADFRAMTRDGVLVIRHEEADEGNPIQLHAEDASPRPRRIDQIIFFAKGDFSSARAPVIPGINAESSEAMIRYGHGTRHDPIEDYDITSNSPTRYEHPEVDDGRFPQTGPNSAFREELALGNPSSPLTNPNLYASDWLITRNVTLLVNPSSSQQDLPLDPTFWAELGLDPLKALDSSIQIAGQPAVDSAFTTLASIFPTAFPIAGYVRDSTPGADRHPTLAGGIIDIATTDLAEIRRIITDVAEIPRNITAETDFFDPANPANSLFDDQFDHSMGMPGHVRFMQAWMDDLFPTDPHPLRVSSPDQAGVRPRYELAIPDFVGTLTNYDHNNNSSVEVFEQSLRLADQQMLGSAVFVPHCSEFIVEYSFGQLVDDPNLPYHGQLIWFGKDRQVTIDGNTFSVVNPYPFDTTSDISRPYAMPYQRLDGSTATRTLSSGLLYRHPTVPPGDEPDVLTAHFGYLDPFYTPADPDTDPDTIPWPWPKLIRVTMTLADPVDPSIEETFQFIFETPETDAF